VRTKLSAWFVKLPPKIFVIAGKVYPVLGSQQLQNVRIIDQIIYEIFTIYL